MKSKQSSTSNKMQPWRVISAFLNWATPVLFFFISIFQYSFNTIDGNWNLTMARFEPGISGLESNNHYQLLWTFWHRQKIVQKQTKNRPKADKYSPKSRQKSPKSRHFVIDLTRQKRCWAEQILDVVESRPNSIKKFYQSKGSYALPK